jgi:hypothetical protein
MRDLKCGEGLGDMGFAEEYASEWTCSEISAMSIVRNHARLLVLSSYGFDGLLRGRWHGRAKLRGTTYLYKNGNENADIEHLLVRGT